MYTECYLSLKLEIKTSDSIAISFIRYLFDSHFNYSSDEKSFSLFKKRFSNHSFFLCERWGRIANSCSYMFNLISIKGYITGHEYEKSDGISYNTHFISSRFDLKNYDNEIQKFFDLIYELIDPETFYIGHWQYENDKEPTHIYYKKDKEEFMKQFYNG